MKIYTNLSQDFSLFQIGKLLNATFGHEKTFSAGDCCPFAVALENVLTEKHYPVNLALINSITIINRKRNNKINFPTHVAVCSNSYFLDHTGCHTWEEIRRKCTSANIKVTDYTLFDDYFAFATGLQILNDSLDSQKVGNYLKEYDYHVYSDLRQEIATCLVASGKAGLTQTQSLSKY